MDKEQETAFEEQAVNQPEPENPEACEAARTEEEQKTDTQAAPEAEEQGPEEEQPEEAAAEAGEAGEQPDGAGAEEAEEEQPEETAGGETSDGKWNFFGRKKKDPRDEQIEELTDRLRRTMAEFDNFRKRTEKEKSAMFEIGAKDIIERILPVIDNFERGLSSMPEEVKGTPFANGMEMIYKQLLKNLEDAGVKPIEAAGQPFDPNFHNAVMHVEDENLGENVVAQELQKGYMYRDSVVRHSMVQVAN